jgi:hypothetical protein
MMGGPWSHGLFPPHSLAAALFKNVASPSDKLSKSTIKKFLVIRNLPWPFKD